MCDRFFSSFFPLLSNTSSRAEDVINSLSSVRGRTDSNIVRNGNVRQPNRVYCDMYRLRMQCHIILSQTENSNFKHTLGCKESNNNYACKPTCIIFQRKVVKWRHQRETFGTYILGGYISTSSCAYSFNIYGESSIFFIHFSCLHKGCAHLFWQLNSGRSPIFMQTGHMELTSARGIISESVVAGR